MHITVLDEPLFNMDGLNIGDLKIKQRAMVNVMPINIPSKIEDENLIIKVIDQKANALTDKSTDKLINLMSKKARTRYKEIEKSIEEFGTPKEHSPEYNLLKKIENCLKVIKENREEIKKISEMTDPHTWEIHNENDIGKWNARFSDAEYCIHRIAEQEKSYNSAIKEYHKIIKARTISLESKTSITPKTQAAPKSKNQEIITPDKMIELINQNVQDLELLRSVGRRTDAKEKYKTLIESMKILIKSRSMLVQTPKEKDNYRKILQEEMVKNPSIIPILAILEGTETSDVKIERFTKHVQSKLPKELQASQSLKNFISKINLEIKDLFEKLANTIQQERLAKDNEAKSIREPEPTVKVKPQKKAEPGVKVDKKAAVDAKRLQEENISRTLEQNDVKILINKAIGIHKALRENRYTSTFTRVNIVTSELEIKNINDLLKQIKTTLFNNHLDQYAYLPLVYEKLMENDDFRKASGKFIQTFNQKREYLAPSFIKKYKEAEIKYFMEDNKVLIDQITVLKTRYHPSFEKQLKAKAIEAFNTLINKIPKENSDIVYIQLRSTIDRALDKLYTINGTKLNRAIDDFRNRKPPSKPSHGFSFFST